MLPCVGRRFGIPDLYSCIPKVGPSSSHTVGPMRAGKIFINDLEELGLLDQVRGISSTCSRTLLK